MPRLRNADTGVVVDVDDETASHLVGEWGPVDAPKRGRGRPPKKAENASGSDNA